MDNKGALDLCIALGIEVKSHSSSIEDAQADRVRRKAEREGLVKPPQMTGLSAVDEAAIAEKETPGKKSSVSKETEERKQKDRLNEISTEIEKNSEDSSHVKKIRSVPPTGGNVPIGGEAVLSPFEKEAAVVAGEHGKVIRSRPASELAEHVRSPQPHPRQT